MTYDLVALESEVSDTEDTLRDLDGWEGIWLKFWGLLQKIVEACKGEETIYDKAPRVERWIAEVDKCRLDLRARRSRALGSYMCPALVVFLDTSIRTDEDGRFFDLISSSVHEESDDDEGDEEDVVYRVVSPEHLDVAIDECRSVIAERRLSLQNQLERQRRTLSIARSEQTAERAYELAKQAADHEHELAKLKADRHPVRIFLDWLPGAAWSLLKDPAKRYLSLLILAGFLAIGPFRRPIVSFVAWLTSHTTLTPQTGDSTPRKPAPRP